MRTLLQFLQRAWLLLAALMEGLIAAKSYVSFVRENSTDGLRLFAVIGMVGIWLAALYFVVAKQRVTDTLSISFPLWQRIASAAVVLTIPIAGLFVFRWYRLEINRKLAIAVARFAPTNVPVGVDQVIAEHLRLLSRRYSDDLAITPINVQIPSNALTARDSIRDESMDAAVWGWYRATPGSMYLRGYFEPLDQRAAEYASQERTEFGHECALNDSEIAATSIEIACDVRGSIILALGARQIAKGHLIRAVAAFLEVSNDQCVSTALRANADALLARSYRSLGRSNQASIAIQRAATQAQTVTDNLERARSAWKNLRQPRPPMPADQRLANAYIAIGDTLKILGEPHRANEAYRRATVYSPVQLPTVWARQDALGRSIGFFQRNGVLQ